VRENQMIACGRFLRATAVSDSCMRRLRQQLGLLVTNPNKQT